MSSRDKKQYLFCYDITNEKRLQQLHRLMVKNAVPVQYSVFHASLRSKQLVALKKAILDIIDSDCDDVRIYPLPAKVDIITVGNSFFPKGIHLIDNKINVFLTD